MMELESWEATFESNFENGSTSESSTSRIVCDSSNPVMMRWKADKNGSQASLVGPDGSKDTADIVSMCVLYIILYTEMSSHIYHTVGGPLESIVSN